MKFKVSLIVPLFNASPYIERFLQIALGQTLADVEIILVDDCSKDDWKEKARRFLEMNDGAERVKFASTSDNGGPGAARNVGLEMATGEYVCFVDCDDEPSDDYCEKLYSEAKRWNADIVCCDAFCDGKILEGPSFPSGEISDKLRCRILSNFVTYLWTYAFRRQFLIDSNIHFPETRSAEDSAFVTWAWLRAQRASHLLKALYTYILHPGSLTRARMKNRARQRIESMQFLKRHSGKVDFPVNLALEWTVFKKGYLMALKDMLR